MWIFAKEGFLSIVQYQTKPDRLLVRSRVKGDLENYFPRSKVIRTPDHDYLYRTTVPRESVAARIASAVMAIDYDTAKGGFADKRRARHYLNVWDAMYEMQVELGEGK